MLHSWLQSYLDGEAMACLSQRGCYRVSMFLTWLLERGAVTTSLNLYGVSMASVWGESTISLHDTLKGSFFF